MTKVIWEANMVIPTFGIEDPVAKNHIALRRGPLKPAQDNRLGYNVDDAVSIESKNGYTDVKISDNETMGFDTIVSAKVPLSNGTYMTVIMTKILEGMQLAKFSWCSSDVLFENFPEIT